MAEICLEFSDVSREWRLHQIDREGGVARLSLIASEEVDAAWVPAQQNALKSYGRLDPDLARHGQALFTTMFKGRVGQEWERLIRTHGGTLRTSVCVSASAATHIPWELARWGMAPLVVKGPFVRTKTLAPEDDKFEPVWPVRILVINAVNPADTTIQAEEEIWKIREALRAAYHSFDLEVYDTASDPDFTTTGIRAAMKRWPDGPHILHFIGHSVPSELKLYFAVNGKYLSWDLAMISAAVSELPQLRLVYINACRSNVQNGDPAAPWSVADAFLETAVAVISMQADISGKAAQSCAGAFYGALAAGQAVDYAFLAARRALLADFGGQSIEVFAPALTTRLPAPSILQIRCRDFPPTRHSNWQTSLRDKWAHFVNQHVARRSLISALFEPAPASRGVVVWGDGSVGKSWLVNWTSYALALNGVQVHYVDASERSDWLDVIRSALNGNASPASPALSPVIRNEFNWKLNHLALGMTPPPYPAGQEVTDTAGSHPAIMAGGKAINGFDALVCEAFVQALRQEARISPRVLIIDKPKLPTTAMLKRPLLDVLAQTTAAESVHVILCCQTDQWKGYPEQGLDFSSWTKIPIEIIESRQITRLIRELLRLQFPRAARENPQLYASVERMLVESDPPPMSAGDLYALCSSFGRLKGLHV
ncbi:CHAT domain-containing protein [Bradyrhizobium sp. HKCCYLRH1073]|uniref:CHAT domain-containing protein n=1 Tax=unclassified Bradyrhizobium TaxID=2631580 RepID=UPI003EC0BC15